MALDDRGWRRWVYGGWAAGEVLLVAGIVHGWPSLVFLLKLLHVNEHLCHHDVTSGASPNHSTPMPYVDEQDMAKDSLGSGNNRGDSLYDVQTPNALYRPTTNHIDLSDVTSPYLHLLNGSASSYGISNADTYHFQNGLDVRNESEAVDNDVISGCEEQDSAFALSYTIIVTVMAFGTVLIGLSQKTLGILATRLICGVLIAAGFLMTGFTSLDQPLLVIPGMACSGTGGLALLITNMQLGDMFHKGRTTFVCLVCSCYDVSAIVQLLIKIVVIAGADFLYTYIGMTLISCLTFISTLLWLPRGRTVTLKSHTDETGTAELSPCNGDSQTAARAPESPEPGTQKHHDERYITSTALVKNLTSLLFLLHVLWFSLLQLRFFFFLGDLNRWLTQLTDGVLSQVDHYTSVQLYMGIASFVFGVLAGTLYDVQRHKYKNSTSREGRLLAPGVAPLSLASGLCCLLSVLVLLRYPHVLYVTFLVQAAFRSFTYSLAATFLHNTFPAEVFAILYGTMIICGGILGCLQYALFLWADTSLNSAIHVNILLLCTSALTFLHPLRIVVLCRRARSKTGLAGHHPVNSDQQNLQEETDLHDNLLDEDKP